AVLAAAFDRPALVGKHWIIAAGDWAETIGVRHEALPFAFAAKQVSAAAVNRAPQRIARYPFLSFNERNRAEAIEPQRRTARWQLRRIDGQRRLACCRRGTSRCACQRHIR